MKQTLYKFEHCNLGEEVDSDVARKTSAANALMSERERERKYFRLENATQAAKVLYG